MNNMRTALRIGIVFGVLASLAACLALLQPLSPALDDLTGYRTLDLIEQPKESPRSVADMSAIREPALGYLLVGAVSIQSSVQPWAWWMGEHERVKAIDLPVPKEFHGGRAEAVGRVSAGAVTIIGRAFGADRDALVSWELSTTEWSAVAPQMIDRSSVGYGPPVVSGDANATYVVVDAYQDPGPPTTTAFAVGPSGRRWATQLDATLGDGALLLTANGALLAVSRSGGERARSPFVALDIDSGDRLELELESMPFFEHVEAVASTDAGFIALVKDRRPGSASTLILEVGSSALSLSDTGFVTDSGAEGDIHADLSGSFDFLDLVKAADDESAFLVALRHRATGLTELAHLSQDGGSFWTLDRLQTFYGPCSPSPILDAEEVDGVKLASLPSSVAWICRTTRGAKNVDFPTVLTHDGSTFAAEPIDYNDSPSADAVDVRFTSAREYRLLLQLEAASSPDHVWAKMATARVGVVRTAERPVYLMESELGASLGTLGPTATDAWVYRTGSSDEAPYHLGLVWAATDVAGGGDQELDVPSQTWRVDTNASERLAGWGKSDSGNSTVVNLAAENGYRQAHLLLRRRDRALPAVALESRGETGATEACDTDDEVVAVGHAGEEPRVWIHRVDSRAEFSRVAPVERLLEVESAFAGGVVLSCSTARDAVRFGGRDAAGRGLVVTARLKGTVIGRTRVGPCSEVADIASAGPRYVLAITSPCNPTVTVVETRSGDGSVKSRLAIPDVAQDPVIRVGPDEDVAVVRGHQLGWPVVVEVAARDESRD